MAGKTEEKIVKKPDSKNSANAKKIVDLKIELLKNPTKRKSIKREIARLLTMAHTGVPSNKDKAQSSSGNNQTKQGETA